MPKMVILGTCKTVPGDQRLFCICFSVTQHTHTPHQHHFRDREERPYGNSVGGPKLDGAEAHPETLLI